MIPLASGRVPATATRPSAPDRWGVDDARRVVAAAALRLGLPLASPDQAECVQIVSTAVFRVGDVAVKVYPPHVDVTRLTAVQTALPAAADSWILPLAEPVVTEDGTAVAYPWVDHSREATWAELGGLLRRWHAAPVDATCLPVWTPLTRVPRQLASYAARPDSEPGLTRVLMTARDRVLADVANLRSDLGCGAIHGDVSPSNAMRRDGRLLLIDLDFVAWGPREYDLVPAAQRRDRGEIDEETYAQFCAAYGHDVREWSGLGVVQEVCDLGGLTFALAMACARGEDVSWLPDAVARWS